MKKLLLFALSFFLCVAAGRAAENSGRIKFSSTFEPAKLNVDRNLPVPKPALSDAYILDLDKLPDEKFMRKSDRGAEYLEEHVFHPEGLVLDDFKVVSRVVPKKYTGHFVGSENFAVELAHLTSSKFTGANSIKLLFGPESFAMRDKLMSEAKKSIYISVYSFHDDITGNQTADLLIAKKKQGVDVKVLVDWKIAVIHGRRVLRRMERAGVEVLRYWEKGRLLDIWHAKILIVDGKYAFVGGMNIGDAYSHRDPAGPKWKDFDVFYSGPAVNETLEIYAGQWNSYASSPLSRIDLKKVKSDKFENGSAELAVVFQNPPGQKGILDSILKSIYGARRRINIANSYFIAIPALRQAILDATRRGVEVNIITNTSKSIDSEAKQAAVPIIRSLAAIYPSGVNIYLNQGENLHAKFMTVDGAFATIGSYNMHPRSEKYDTEINVNVLGKDSVRQFDRAFHKLIENARKVTSPNDLTVENGFMTFISNLIEKYFFSMLNPGTGG